ncbi:hypothetical protein CI109_106838 [Kwoniella shandongensis]|uniref:Uncharacterized protein n=1 Tax=Kwoniella shandongensis TaxID=1734106 RepID=A0A5M6C6H5_9TREE|nr:uncharacterized protein CI109_000906 [Kwoniella shandongensis]KAA5530726.1 hypothetical protein CI109_000906 [Kwoniella shandongensis]
MSGFILGTGSGVLAAAAVYYTLSTSLNAQTASLRSELHSSSHLLSSSFDPTTPPAPSSFVGPQYPSHQITFSQLVRQKWNDSISSLVFGVRKTDWESVGKEVWGVGESVVNSISTATTTSPTTSASGSSSSVGEAVTPSIGGIPGGTIYPIAGGALDHGGVVDDVKQGAKEVVEKTQGVDLHIGKEGRVRGVESVAKTELAKVKGRMV